MKLAPALATTPKESRLGQIAVIGIYPDGTADTRFVNAKVALEAQAGAIKSGKFASVVLAKPYQIQRMP